MDAPVLGRYVEAMRHGWLWITGALGGAQLGCALADAREGPHGARSGHAARRNGASVERCEAGLFMMTSWRTAVHIHIVGDLVQVGACIQLLESMLDSSELQPAGAKQ